MRAALAPPTFEAAFYSHEEWPAEHLILAHAYEREATCYHEAGHAVVGWWLGLGLTKASVYAAVGTAPDGNPGYSYGGLVTFNARKAAALGRAIDAGAYCREALVHGVVSCAGPAAEYRFRQDTGTPQRLLGGGHGDHHDVDAVGKRLEEFSDRGRFAYRRLVWRHAWAAVNRDDLWPAIVSMADALKWGFDEAEPEKVAEHGFALEGRAASAIVRRAVRAS